MSSVVRITQSGGPDVMALEQAEVGAPGPGQVLLRQTAVGVNYIDVYHRTGAYPLPLPSGLGVEAAGVVEAVGEGVAALREGDRAAYAGASPGAYAEARLFPADRLVAIPAGVTDEQAAAALFKGITAQYLIKATYPVGPGTTVLLYAAAGGVGSILSAWASHLGATVIGVVSDADKADLARAAGCAHALLWGTDDIAAEARRITGGRGVDVAYDSVGADTWAASLDALRSRGMMVSFGGASGPVPPVDLAQLGAKSSLFLTRPSIAAHIASPAEYRQRAAEVFGALEAGVIRPRVWRRYALGDVGKAHADLEARRTNGALLLLPSRSARDGGPGWMFDPPLEATTGIGHD